MYKPIKDSMITEGRAVIGALMLRVRNNFISHESRINDLAATPNSVPTGTTLMYGGASAPTGFLLCDGSVVSQATYPDLFSIVGTLFNTGGEGGGNFRLPDFRGRMVIGAGDGGASFTDRDTGDSGGTETHDLTTAELPVHTHAKADPGHTHTLPTGNAGGSGRLQTYSSYTGGDVTVDVSSVTTGISFANTGGGDPHENMQPSLAVNWLIKT